MGEVWAGSKATSAWSKSSVVSLHCHLFGYNDFSTFRALTDKSPERHTKLAQFLERIIFNKVTTFSDVTLAFHGHGAMPPPSPFVGTSSTVNSDPLLRPAKECLAIIHLPRGHGSPGMVPNAAGFTTLLSPDWCTWTSPSSLLEPIYASASQPATSTFIGTLAGAQPFPNDYNHR